MIRGAVPHVALLIETSREYARGLLRGVSRYHREHGPWSIYFEPHGLDDPPPPWLKDWRGDGILARVNDKRMADAILSTGIPAVDVRGALPDLTLPFIGVDNDAVVQLGFEHLQSCGLENFAFCGTPRGENPNQDRRCDHFVDLVQQAGFECHVSLGLKIEKGRATWEQEQQQISKWVKSLPKPAGIMTCHDDRGQQTLDACRRAEINVPDEVAVISVDNDSYLCNLCSPPLSSIDVNSSRIGYEAAALLARLMNGDTPPSGPVLLGPPRGIAARQSSDMLAIADDEVASAIRYIRQNAANGIRVSDVVARARRSPSTLERRIKKLLDRTIKSEITRVRMMRAKLLLRETEYPVSEVALRTGFAESKYFCGVFRRLEGMTPTQFRRHFRDEV